MRPSCRQALALASPTRLSRSAAHCPLCPSAAAHRSSVPRPCLVRRPSSPNRRACDTSPLRGAGRPTARGMQKVAVDKKNLGNLIRCAAAASNATRAHKSDARARARTQTRAPRRPPCTRLLLTAVSDLAHSGPPTRGACAHRAARTPSAHGPMWGNAGRARASAARTRAPGARCSRRSGRASTTRCRLNGRCWRRS